MARKLLAAGLVLTAAAVGALLVVARQEPARAPTSAGAQAPAPAAPGVAPTPVPRAQEGPATASTAPTPAPSAAPADDNEPVHKVMQVLMTGPADAQEQARQLAAAVEDSGAASESWSALAPGLVTRITDELFGKRLQADVRVDPVRCFAAACMFELVYLHGAGLDADAISNKLGEWPGGKIVTPTLDSGDASPRRQTVILLRPKSTAANVPTPSPSHG